MISFQRDDWQFDFRVAGIAIHREHVLLESHDVWFLPGGRVNFGELAGAALLREMREETGLEVALGRLVWIVESFFTLDSRRHHEIGFYYLIALPPEAAQLDLTKGFHVQEENGAQLLFQWHPLAALADLPLHPSFLRTSLIALPTSITHIIQIDSH